MLYEIEQLEKDELDYNFVKAIVSNQLVTQGKVYKIEGYDNRLKAILIRNENPSIVFALVDAPLEWFTPVFSEVIHVDFVRKTRVA